jgi:peptidoglycan/LPS O-acetylase OafA/YrhL
MITKTIKKAWGDRMPSGASFASRTGINSRLHNATSKKNLRPDIQGLRMLAVIAVILDHLVAWPSGGFVGVDVFFVISGFLITGILIREHEKTNHISFVQFYKRRLKRIVPAATLTLVLTVLASFFLLNSTRFGQTVWDSVFAFFFTANWHFAAAGTDYFQAAGPVSPLQHFWSLSVEEQFYFVWPWAMLGLLALAGIRKTFARKRTLVGVAMGLIIVASFAWALVQSADSPTVAYFSTLTRAWELGLGALLAIASPWWGHLPRLARPILGWIGLAGILLSYVLINDTMPFPAPWAVLPVVATALVIVGGTGGEQRFLWPLTNPVSFYIGNISYSLYLWHFPVIVLLSASLGSNPLIYYPTAVLLIAILSIGSYYLVEEPVQRSPWLERKSSSERRELWARWRSTYGNRLKFGWLGALSAVCAALVVAGLVITPAAPPPVASLGTPEPTTPGTAQAPPLTALEIEQAAIREALAASDFPQLVPAIADLGFTVWADQMQADGCVNVTEENVEDCVYGAESGRDVVLFGDSIAMAWLPAVRAAFEDSGWRVHQLTLAECPSVDVEVTHAGGGEFPECGPWRDWAVQTIAGIEPELTIVASSDSTVERLVSEAQGDAMRAEIAAGTGSLLDRVKGYSGRTVLLGPPPHGANLQTCATPGATPTDCVQPPGEPWTSFNRSQSEAATISAVEFVDTQAWFCDRLCPSFAGNTPIRVDSLHMTREFSALLGPVLSEAVNADGTAILAP